MPDITLDAAATSFQKPEGARRAMWVRLMPRKEG